MRLLLFVLAIALSLPSMATAQTSRYSSWSNPGTQASGGDAEARLKTMIEKLNKLVDDAEKANAADPVFLRDLRNLANGYTRPWTTTLLDEGFTDGDYTQNPAWQVLSGEYYIEKGWGLRNKLLKKPQTSQSSNSGGDLAKVLLGQILNQAAGNKNQAATATENAIVTRLKISNAFAIKVNMSSWVSPSHFEIGVFQGQAAQNGYRLLYESGKGLQLQRVGSRGTSVVDTTAKPLTLEDKKFHDIEWTRGGDGTMTVSVDGETLLTTVDRGFSDAFDGLRFSDRGGDFIIKHVTVDGV